MTSRCLELTFKRGGFTPEKITLVEDMLPRKEKGEEILDSFCPPHVSTLFLESGC